MPLTTGKYIQTCEAQRRDEMLRKGKPVVVKYVKSAKATGLVGHTKRAVEPEHECEGVKEEIPRRDAVTVLACLDLLELWEK